MLVKMWNSRNSSTAAQSLQSCPTLCSPTDGSPPGSPVPGPLQARTLEWAAISFLQCMKGKSESEVAQSANSLRPHGLQPTRLLRPWEPPGKSTGVGCHRMQNGTTTLEDSVLISYKMKHVFIQ